MSKHLCFLCNCFILTILLKKKLWKKTTVCNGIAEYAAHVFYLVILALRISDDISWHVGGRNSQTVFFFFFWLLNCNIVDRFFFFPLFSLIRASCTGFFGVCASGCVLICFLIHSYPLCLSYYCPPGYLNEFIHLKREKKCCFKKCFLLLQ